MLALILILATSMALAGCGSPSSQPPEYWIGQVEAPDPKEARFPGEVSLIRLIASPQDFDGRYIRVFGYLHMEFERDAIFVGKEDCERWLEPNSISIGVSRTEMKKKMQELSDRYVLLEGKFHYRRGDPKGTIWRITRVEPNLTPTEISAEMKKEEPNSEGSAAPQRAAGPRLNKPGSSED